MPPYTWTTPICLDAPIYLDDVWMPPVHTQHKESMLCQTKEVSIWPHTCGCPLYINNTKKACFVRLRGCPYAPYIWMAPYVWMPPVCLDAPCMFRCHHMFGCPTVCLDAAKCMVASKGMRDIQTYGGCPNIKGHLNIWGHPNVFFV